MLGYDCFDRAKAAIVDSVVRSGCEIGARAKSWSPYPLRRSRHPPSELLRERNELLDKLVKASRP